MYGKCYESMYEGSMVGSGINVFAVWNYIIVKQRRGIVEINPRLLAFTLGGTEREVKDALEFLQKPDPESRSKAEEGRRIIKEGEFQYRLVNWEYYDQMRNDADRREYNRLKQAQYRAEKREGKITTPVDEGDEESDARRRRVMAKIEREERACEAVRRNFNPEHKQPDKWPVNGENIKTVSPDP